MLVGSFTAPVDFNNGPHSAASASAGVREQSADFGEHEADAFGPMRQARLEERVVELKGSLNEAETRIQDLEQEVRLLRAKEGVFKRVVASHQQKQLQYQQQQHQYQQQQQQQQEHQYQVKQEHHQEQYQVKQEEGQSSDEKIQGLERMLNLARVRDSLMKRALTDTREKLAKAEFAATKAEERAERADRKTGVIDVIAAEEHAANNALSAVVARCIEALKPILVDDDIKVMEEENPREVIPRAMQTLGEQLLVSDAARAQASDDYKRASVLLEQSENECDQLQAALDQQIQAVAKMEEIVKQGADQYNKAVEQNTQLCNALKGD